MKTSNMSHTESDLPPANNLKGSHVDSNLGPKNVMYKLVNKISLLKMFCDQQLIEPLQKNTSANQ